MRVLKTRLLFFFIIPAIIISCGDDSSITDSLPDLEADAVITINNVNSSAWIVVSIDGEGASAETDVENAAITLEAGNRYLFVNLGAANHPFELRDADGEVLIAEAGNGELQDDEDVAVVVDESEGTIEFTLSGDLAARVATYNCQPHPSMVGDLIVN
jgi:plastocyanin